MNLSPRQTEIIRLIAAGLRDKEIADRLGISVKTVNIHVWLIIRRLKAGSRSHAAVIWADHTPFASR